MSATKLLEMERRIARIENWAMSLPYIDDVPAFVTAEFEREQDERAAALRARAAADAPKEGQ